MIRNPFIRRLIVALILLTGPLTQLHALYAYELMAYQFEQPSMVCCCDEPDDMDIMGCELGGLPMY